jgi:2-polyprenyl-3-methyl-5-hydroxy-6-metoxy-1,4-benzoquinol methylase
MNNSTGHRDDSHSAVQRFFDRQAGHFPEVGDDSAGVLQRAANAILRRSLLLRFERVFERMGPLDGRSILDVGCGSGTYAVRAASAGAARVVGIDLAPAMIRLARERATSQGVANRCEFLAVDCLEFQTSGSFDFVVAMGVMDYVADPAPFVTRVIQLTNKSAFLSFPKSGGILAWQRRLRYRRKCPLFMYSREDLQRLSDTFTSTRFEIESLARDWFVTIHRETR